MTTVIDNDPAAVAESAPAPSAEVIERLRSLLPPVTESGTNAA